MTPAACYANFLVSQSERNREIKEEKRLNELQSLQKELLEEQLKEVRLRNELLKASLDDIRVGGNVKLSI